MAIVIPGAAPDPLTPGLNFLQLAQRLRRRCRVIGTGPTDVVAGTQNEEYSRLIDFTNEAWVAIQLMHPNWAWMRQTMTFPTVAAQAQYTLAQINATGTNFTNFGNWAPDSFRAYLTSVGFKNEYVMGYLPYDQWYATYQIGSLRTVPSQPTAYTVLPLLGIGLGATPIVGYTILGDYYKAATEMAVAADEPALPGQFRMLIVYRAMMLFAAGESAGEIYQTGQALYTEMLDRLQLQQLPEMLIGGSML